MAASAPSVDRFWKMKCEGNSPHYAKAAFLACLAPIYLGGAGLAGKGMYTLESRKCEANASSGWWRLRKPAAFSFILEASGSMRGRVLCQKFKGVCHALSRRCLDQLERVTPFGGHIQGPDECTAVKTCLDSAANKAWKLFEAGGVLCWHSSLQAFPRSPPTQCPRMAQSTHGAFH